MPGIYWFEIKINWQNMQNSNKRLEGSRLGNTIIRQYSTILNNNSADAIIQNMTQSSKAPFSELSYRFNSSSPKNAFGVTGFNKHSDAKSIIQKLMQTKQIKNNFEFENALENSFVKNPIEIKRIQINQTQAKIFRQVINIIDQIQQLKAKLSQQTQQFTQLKTQMKQVGLQFPQIEEEEQTKINFKSKRLTEQELNLIFDQNQKLQAQIKKKTQQLINNKGSQINSEFKKAKNQNSVLRIKAQQLRNIIYSSGDINEQQMNELRMNIERLKVEVSRLQQNRFNKLSQTDSQILQLKDQNQILRSKTLQILRDKNQNIVGKKKQLISFLQSEQANRQRYMRQIQQLRAYYDQLVQQNSSVSESPKGPSNSRSYNTRPYDSLHMQSKVNYSSNQIGKQNFNNNYGKQGQFRNYNKDSLKGKSNDNQFEEYENLLRKMKEQTRK